jgi:methylmalonyl-CoA mutase cobalamin-binding subunit
MGVPLWGDEHFRLLKEMAESLAAIGQKAITVIAGEIPWKGWF